MSTPSFETTWWSTRSKRSAAVTGTVTSAATAAAARRRFIESPGYRFPNGSFCRIGVTVDYSWSLSERLGERGVLPPLKLQDRDLHHRELRVAGPLNAFSAA